jgi:hypothetical protein
MQHKLLQRDSSINNPVIVTAIGWYGTNLKEIEELLGGNLLKAEGLLGGPLALTLRDGEDNEERAALVEVGSYVVLIPPVSDGSAVTVDVVDDRDVQLGMGVGPGMVFRGKYLALPLEEQEYGVVDHGAALQKQLKEAFAGLKKDLNLPEPRILNISPSNGTQAAVPDLIEYGQADMFKCLSKASSKRQGWMKSTKAMNIPGGGVVIQVSSLQTSGSALNPMGSLAEALVFVPGVKVVGDKAAGYRLEELSKPPA